MAWCLIRLSEMLTGLILLSYLLFTGGKRRWMCPAVMQGYTK